MYNYCERKDMLSLLGRDSGSSSFSLARIIHNVENTMNSSRLLVHHAMHMYDVRLNNTRIRRNNRVAEVSKNDCPRFSSAKESSLT